MLQICDRNRHVPAALRRAALTSLVGGVLSPDSAGQTILLHVS
jgi:hypothetical protein